MTMLTHYELESYRTKTDDFTHVCMGSQKGRYIIPRNARSKLYSGDVNSSWGVAERVSKTHYSMFRVDLDFQTALDAVGPVMEDVADQAIETIRNVLAKHVIQCDPKITFDACVHLKPPYIHPEKQVRKYGVHIIFSDLYLTLLSLKFLEKELSPLIDGFDSISSNPWLIYGQHKNSYSGTYVAAYVSRANGEKVDPVVYYSMKPVYDFEENLVVPNATCSNIYPYVFSIYSVRMSGSSLLPTVPKPVRIEMDQITEDIDVHTQRTYEEDCKIYDQLVALMPMLSTERSDDRQSWLLCGWALHRLGYTSLSSDQYLTLWLDFSERSSKYDEDICHELWTNMDAKNCRVKLGSIHYWAKTDSPEAYLAWKLDQSQETIRESYDGDQLSLASVFSTLYGDRIRIPNECSSEYYEWDSKKRLWISHHKNAMPQTIGAVLIPFYKDMMYRLMDECDDDEDQQTFEAKQRQVKVNLIQKLIHRLGGANFLVGIRNLLTKDVHPDFTTEVINRCTNELPILDGKVIDLRTLMVRERTINDYWSFECPVTFLGEDANLEIVKKFFSEITRGDEALIAYLHRYCGYLLTGEISERDMMIMWGKGCNGKTSLINIINNILGPFSVALSDDVMMKKDSRGATPELMNLKDARVGVLPESDKEEELNSKRIKALTGNDVISARPLYGSPIEFKTQAKFLWATNHKPKINTEDQAILDRIKLVPFLATFAHTRANTYYIKHLQEDKLSEFFTWFCIGAAEWYAGDNLVPCSVMTEAKEEYIGDNDVLSQFIADVYTVISKDEYAKIGTADKKDFRTVFKAAYAKFVAWLSMNQMLDVKIGRNAFIEAMSKKIDIVKNQGRNCYLCYETRDHTQEHPSYMDQ